MYNIKNLIYYFFKGIVSLPKIIISIIIHFFIGLITVLTIFPKYLIIGLKSVLKKDKTIIKNQLKKDNPKKVFIMMCLSFCIYLVCVFLISRYSVQQLKIKYLAETIIENTNTIIEEELITPPENISTPDNNEDDNQENNIESDNINNNESNTQTNTQSYYPNDYWYYINVPIINVDFEQLLTKNPDTVGWIKVNGTKVNYPVVQTTNNEYYLSHAFNGTKNASGWVYADFRADFINFGKNTIIYAHNLTNRTMFGSLVETQKPYWYTNQDNKYIKISTPTTNTVWAIFSTYTIEPTTDYLRTNFKNHNYQEFLNKMRARSIYNFGIDVNENDKILTLSTCNDTGTKRIVVQAKMVTITYR